MEVPPPPPPGDNDQSIYLSQGWISQFPDGQEELTFLDMFRIFQLGHGVSEMINGDRNDNVKFNQYRF